MSITLWFCKFCGEMVNDPCADETDLSNHARTVDRCSDARFARLAEQFYDAHEECFDDYAPVVVGGSSNG